MTFAFECAQCEADFELGMKHILEDPATVVCPNCRSKADSSLVEAAFGNLDEAFSLLARLRRKFRIEFSLDTDEIAESSEDYDTGDDEDALWSNEAEVAEDDEEED